MDFLSHRIGKSENPLNKQLFHLIREKESNLCFSADCFTSEEILKFADQFGPHIVTLKLHVNFINDFNFDRFVPKLLELKKRHKFLIFEDNKYGDSGTTVFRQYTEENFYRIREWADLVTSHINFGDPCIKGLIEGMNASPEPRGILLVAQPSVAGCVPFVNGVEAAQQIAETNPRFVSGFIAQSEMCKDSGFIQFTPGVNIGVNSDGKGQQWVTPEEAVEHRGADIIIVGRGITQAPDPMERMLKFKSRGYQSLIKRLSSFS